jgi:TP901 family phage tail tape measure protein
MTNGLDATAKLELEVAAKGLDQAISSLGEFDSLVGGADRTVTNLTKNLIRAEQGLRDYAGSASTATAATRTSNQAADKGSAAWRQYAEDLSKAQSAYRNFKQGQVGPASASGLEQFTREQQDKLLATHEAANANLITAIRQRQDAERQAADEAQRAAKEQADYLEAIAASHRRNSNERDKAAQQDRFNQQAAIQEARARESAEAAVTQELQRQAAITGNATRARTTFDGGIDSRLGHAPTGQRASQTGLAGILRAEDLRASTQAGRDYVNMSTQIDATIEQRTRSGQQFAASLREQMQAQADLTNSSPALRYAMYDVASTLGVVSTAMIAAPTATAAAAASFESSFTGVERTARVTGDAAGVLETQLVNLTRAIPESFGNVTQIAQLGAQLDVQASDLAGFTETVAQFSATAGTTVDATAQGFGRIGQLLGVTSAEYQNLGSAILYAGNTSVATEQDVLNYTQRLAIAGKEAGFTAQETVALSATLASLGIGLEASQGATQRIFQDIGRAVEVDQEKLEKFAAVAGVSAEEFANSWRGAPQEAFTQLLRGLATVENQTQALDALGFIDTREVRTLTALSNNLGLYNDQLSSTNQAWSEGTYLGASYGLVVDDLASRFQILINGVMELGATIGTAFEGPLKESVNGLIAMVNGLSEMAKSPAGQFLLGTSAILSGLAGAFLAVVAASALTFGSLGALKFAVSQLGFATATTGIQGFMAGLFGTATASGAAATALTVFKVALAATGIGLAVVALGTLAAAFMQAGTSATNAFNTYVSNTSGLAEALAADTQAYKGAVISGNQEAQRSFGVVSLAADENTSKLGENAQAILNTATVLGVAPPSFAGATGAINDNTVALGANTTEWLKNQLMQSEAFQELAGNQEFVDYWTTIGADMTEAIRIQQTEGQQAVYDYFLTLENQARESGASFKSAFSAAANIDGIGFVKPKLASGDWMGLTLNSGAKGLTQITKIMQGLNGQVLLAGQQTTKASSGIKSFDSSARDLSKTLGGGGGGKKAGGGKQGLTAQVRTLVDYASDLEGVFSRAFDIRYGGQQGLDSIASGWSAIRKASSEAADKMREYRDSMRSLTADRAVSKYWLSVAENYGDTLRAAQLRAEIGEIDGKLKKTSNDLSEAQKANSKTLTGNSEAAVANRATILGLVTDYQGYLGALAASGVSQKELETRSRQLKAEFIAQATQLGFSKAEVAKYSASFDDLTTAIVKVPRNITVKANVNPALQALNELEAKAKRVSNAMGSVGGSLGAGATQSANALEYRTKFAIAAMQASVASLQGALSSNPIVALGHKAAALGYQAQMAQWRRLGGFYTGGYTGDGGKYEPKGIVHGGEFVFSKAATQNIGVANLAHAHKAAQSGQGFSLGQRGAGSSLVDLSPASIMAVAEALRDSVTIVLPGAGLARAVGANNLRESARSA